MPYVKYQPHPLGLDSVGDCVVRAISKAFDCNWDEAFLMITTEAFQQKNMPSANSVVASFLLGHGYKEHSLVSMCKDCYTVEKFAKDMANGTYVCFGDGHVVTMIKTEGDSEGRWFDSFNCRNLPILFYFEKLNDEGGVR